MPAPSRWMIKIALIYLLAAMVMGALMLFNKAFPLHPGLWQLLPVHIEAAIFGWIIQFTLGTAYWILPRFLKGPARGHPLLVVCMILSLNLGIIFVVIASLAPDTFPFRLAGRSLELISVILFIALHWKRVVTYRTGTG